MNGADDVVTAWYEAISDGQDVHSLVQDRYGARSLVAEVREHARTRFGLSPGARLTRDLGDEAIEQAVAAASEADVVVLALGGASLWFTGERTEGEASDTADITLPAAQVRLAEAVAATGTPHRRRAGPGPGVRVAPVIQEAAAIVVAPYAGPFGTRSIAEVLFGIVNPSGKLPYSVPRHSGQIPVYHHQKAGSGYRNPLPPSVTRHYLDMAATPLWPFGHGLSYTTFALSDLDCGPDITRAERRNQRNRRQHRRSRRSGGRPALPARQHHGGHPASPAARRIRAGGAGGGGAAARDVRRSTLHSWPTPISLVRSRSSRRASTCSSDCDSDDRSARRGRSTSPALPESSPARSDHSCRPRPWLRPTHHRQPPPSSAPGQRQLRERQPHAR